MKKYTSKGKGSGGALCRVAANFESGIYQRDELTTKVYYILP